MSWDFDKMRHFYSEAHTALEEQSAYTKLVRAEIVQTLRRRGLQIHDNSLVARVAATPNFWFCEGFWVDPRSSVCLVATDTQNVWDCYDIYASTMRRYPDLGVMSLFRDHSNIAIYRLEREVTDASQIIIGSRYQP